MLKVVIDGVEVEVAEGSNVVKAAAAAGTVTIRDFPLSDSAGSALSKSRARLAW